MIAGKAAGSQSKKIRCRWGPLPEPGTDISLETVWRSNKRGEHQERSDSLSRWSLSSVNVDSLPASYLEQKSRWDCEEHSWIESKRASEERRSTTRSGQMIFDRLTVARHRDYRATESCYVCRLPCRRTAAGDAHRRSVTMTLS